MHIAKCPEKRGFYYGYVIVAAGFWSWFIAWGIYQSFGIFFIPLTTEFGWSRADIVLAYSTVSIVQASTNVLMGWLTDRLGPRLVVTVFGSFLGISYLLMSRISALWQFQTIYALAAIGMATSSAPIMATVARWFAKKRAMMTGIVQAGLGLGGFVFAPVSAWLAGAYGWRSAYATLGFIALASLIVVGLLLRRDPRESGWLPDGERPAATPPKKNGAARSAGGLSLKRAVRARQFWIISGIFFSFGFCRSTFMPHIAAYVQDIGFSLTDGANIIAALTVSSILGRLSMGHINNRVAFMLSFLITASALTWGLFTRNLWGLYLFAFAFGIGWGAGAVLRYVVAAEAFGLGSIGLLMGVLGFIEAAASATGSYFAGAAFDVVGDYSPAFLVGIAISLMGVALTALLKKSPASL